MSERLIVPLSQGNSPHGDPGEGRGRQVTKPLEGNMAGTLDPGTVSTKQQRIAELAKQAPQMGFTSLAHHIDEGWLYQAYLRTRPDGAVGVDGQTIQDFSANLRDNLTALLERAKSGTYRAPPVRRTYIPKGTGTETRPIGIPTFADKVLQRAVGFFASFGCLGEGRVDQSPFPIDLVGAVEFGQKHGVQFQPHSGFVPETQMIPTRFAAATTKFGRQVIPGDAGLENEENASEDHTTVQRLAAGEAKNVVLVAVAARVRSGSTVRR